MAITRSWCKILIYVKCWSLFMSWQAKDVIKRPHQDRHHRQRIGHPGSALRTIGCRGPLHREGLSQIASPKLQRCYIPIKTTCNGRHHYRIQEWRKDLFIYMGIVPVGIRLSHVCQNALWFYQLWTLLKSRPLYLSMPHPISNTLKHTSTSVLKRLTAYCRGNCCRDGNGTPNFGCRKSSNFLSHLVELLSYSSQLAIPVITYMNIW